MGVSAHDATHYPLTLTASAADSRLHLTLKYQPDLFDPDTVRTFADRFLRILAHPDHPRPATRPAEPALPHRAGRVGPGPRPARPVGAHPAAAAHRRRRHRPGRDRPDRCGPHPDLPATRHRLEPVARWLIEHGAGPEGYVAVGMSRSLASVLAVWAITKTGAAFVPIDPHYPTDRIRPRMLHRLRHPARGRHRRTGPVTRTPSGSASTRDDRRTRRPIHGAGH